MANIIIENTLRESFTMISNDFARDPNVTPRAARVYIFLMSHTAGWQTSVARIGKQIGMSRDAAGAAIRDLEALGYVKREEMVNDGGQFAGMSYRIFAVPLPEEERASDGKTVDGKPGNGDDQAKQAKPQVDTDDGKTGDGKTGAGKPGHLRRPSSKKTNPKETNREEEPPQPPRGGSGLAAEQPEKKPAKGKRFQYPDGFEKFWKAYPNRQEKRKAYEAWEKALERADAETIIAGAERYAADPNRAEGFTKYPQGWLNGDRWEDDPLPSRYESMPAGGGQQYTPSPTAKTNPDAWHGGQSFDRDPMLDALLNNRAFPATGHHQATEQFPQFGDPTIRQIDHTINGR